MLYITFKESEAVITNVDLFFDNNYDSQWFLDPMVKRMITDIDKSEVISENIIQSPVLGQIPPSMISGGVKALILMLKTDNVIWATACGDNCARWIVEISKMKDVTICLEHLLHFPDDFEAICVDDGMEIHSLYDYSEEALQQLWGA